MIKPFSTPLLGVLNQSFLSSSESLSRAKSLKIRGDWGGLEHISEVLPRILATLDRQSMGKLSEQGGGIPPGRPPENKEQSPLLVTTSYPLQGGVA
jgi:hypothetical protein